MENQAQMPYSLEDEQKTLGAMMLEMDAIKEATGILKREDFYDEKHRFVFGIITSLFHKKLPVDLVTVVEELRSLGLLEKVDGVRYIATLIDACPSSAQVLDYARVVQALSIQRQLKGWGEHVLRTTSGKIQNLEDMALLLHKARRDLDSIEITLHENNALRTKPLLSSVYEDIEQRFQRRPRILGVSTGFYDLDDITTGFGPGELIVVASAPLMGKTSFVWNIASHVAMSQRLPTLLCALEAVGVRVAEQLLCTEAEVVVRDFKRGFLQDEEWHRVTNAINNLHQAPLFVQAGERLSMQEIRQRAENVLAEHGSIGIIVVDSLQSILFEDGSSTEEERFNELGRFLKVLAGELKAPVILTSRVGDRVRQREDKRPLLSDLSPAGDIDSYADKVIFLYRPGYYKSTHATHSGHDDPDEGIVELIVAKQRGGPTGTVRLGFQPDLGRFVNLAPQGTSR